MLMKRFSLLIGVVAMLAMNVTANVSFTVGKLQFWVCDDGNSVFLQKLVDGQTVSGDLFIPQIVNDGDKDYTVVGISADAFYKQTGLTSVYIPSTVKYIYRTAFYGCTNLADVVIPDNLEYLAEKVFDNTPWFNAKPDGPVYLGNTFYVYKNPKSMPAGTNIVIKDGTTHIACYAFENCANLSSIHIPNSVTSIGDHAFNHCTGLTSVTLPNSAKNLGNSLFYACTGLTDVTLPNTITSIPAQLFSGCRALSSITIPGTVEIIFGLAFYNCTSLTSVNIPNKVKTIGINAFAQCTGLTDITIPNSVRYIGNDAFIKTAWLNNQPDGIVYIGNVAYTYKGTPSGVLTIKDGTTAIANRAFYECSGITVLRLPGSLLYIGDEAFSKCSSLTYLNLPGNVKAIGSNAFSGCTNLTEISFPNTLLQVGGDSGTSAFSGTQWYTDQPDGVVYAGPVAIGYKGSLPNDETVIIVKEGTKAIAGYGVGRYAEKVILPNSVTTIGKYAFYDSYIKEINIPESVTGIGVNAFGGMRYLDRIDAYVDPANVAIGDDALILGMPRVEDYNDKIGTSICFWMTNYFGHEMDDCVLHVLPGKEESFANAWSWARFKNIVGDLSEGGGITGDVNGDGELSIADITALVDLVMRGATNPRSDVNGDGETSVADVTTLVGLLMQ